jgi:hypothetical protein
MPKLPRIHHLPRTSVNTPSVVEMRRASLDGSMAVGRYGQDKT